MYARWRSAEAYEAMRRAPGPQPFLEEALTIARFEPGMYEVVGTFAPIGESLFDRRFQNDFTCVLDPAHRQSARVFVNDILTTRSSNVKQLLAVFALMVSGFTAFGDEPDVVEGARRAAAGLARRASAPGVSRCGPTKRPPSATPSDATASS